MLPIGDVIPSRTRPVLTAVLAVGALALIGPPALRPWAIIWMADGLAIWMFGATLEDRMGRARFAAFAATGAAAAAAVAALTAPIPLVLIAAGGTAAMLGGGYLARFPTAPMLALVPTPAGVEIVEVPAWFIAAAWGVVHAATALGAATASVSLALAGGWLAAAGLGALLVWPFSRRERDHSAWWGA